MQSMDLYEKKVLNDIELPIQLGCSAQEKKGEYFPSHWHEHIEIQYVLEGCGTFYINHKPVKVEAGEMLVINSNEMHNCICDRLPYRVQTLIFTMESLSEELAKKNIVFQTLIKREQTIAILMEKLRREMAEKKPGYKQMCKSLTLQLVVHLFRNYTVEMLEQKDSLKRKRNLDRLNTVLLYIDHHYTENISNRQLAELIYLSEDRFNHLFRENMGMPPLQYMNELRLKKAKNLILRKECTIVEAAASVGFPNYNHFGRLFRRYYGCTPQEMRDNIVTPKAAPSLSKADSSPKQSEVPGLSASGYDFDCCGEISG